jgi:non-specific serine/threonine protein kinase
VVESLAEKQGIGRASFGQLKKVNVVRFITKTRRGKIIRLQENKKLLSDALLDEPHQP